MSERIRIPRPDGEASEDEFGKAMGLALRQPGRAPRDGAEPNDEDDDFDDKGNPILVDPPGRRHDGH
jgi:hypothetical protein